MNECRTFFNVLKCKQNVKKSKKRPKFQKNSGKLCGRSLFLVILHVPYEILAVL